MRPPDARLHGRQAGHRLRPRQQALLHTLLPRLRYPIGIAPREAFGPFDRLGLEVGFGGGEHSHALVQADPAFALIACEVFEPGLCSMLSRLAPEEIDTEMPTNLRLWDNDARLLMRTLPRDCLDFAFLMFPDPWPKLRHAKRRFVHPDQVPLVARLVRPGGMWRVATDDPTYQAWVMEVMAMQNLFDAPAPETARPAGWPPTRYEAKAIRAGRTPLYWTFTRTGVAVADDVPDTVPDSVPDSVPDTLADDVTLA